MRRRPASRSPREVAPGVYQASGGPRTNVYFVRSDAGWVLVDTGWRGQAEPIRAQAEAVFGPGAHPAAIVLTHIHPDHSSSALPLARLWGVPVYLHPDEMPMAGPDYPLEYVNRVDRRFARWYRRVVQPLIPRARLERMRAETDLRGVAERLEPSAAPPGMPGWELVPAPGHTPGHVALFRRDDRVVITGDAAMTIDANSVLGITLGRPTLSGPPQWFTWSWARAVEAVEVLAALEPRVVLPGHGEPLAGPDTAAQLRRLADELEAGHTASRLPQGFGAPVVYNERIAYRRPPSTYLRGQRIGPLLTRLGISPRYVVTLEVPGRRSGILRRTTLARAHLEGADYLVALAGESDWVRNVRAAGGRVILGRKDRRAATLVEVPPEERAPVIRAYVLRAGRRPGTPAVTTEARAFFGVGQDLSLDELAKAAPFYPVFRIVDGWSPVSNGRSP